MGRLWFSIRLALFSGACGARSELSLGPPTESAEEGGGGGGIGPVDPELACPLACTVEACQPAVLVDDVAVGWHAIVDGILYYTTSKPEGDNGLFRVGACGGEPELLLAADRFYGYGAVTGDEVYVTTGDPSETVRLPKGGGAATLFHSDAGDELTTQAVVGSSYGSVLLVRYHFDESFGFYGYDEDGQFIAWVTNFPDSDYGALPSDGFGFLPNAPASGYVGTAVGVLRAVPPGGLSSIPVRGPLVARGEELYFTGDTPQGTQHYEVSSTASEPEAFAILGAAPGMILAADDEALFGGSLVTSAHTGTVWRALPDAESPSDVFRSGEYVQDVVPAGNSLYVRTERRIVRTPKACPPGAASPCATLD